MKIPSAEIDIKQVVGRTSAGNAIVYIATKGGLHAFFAKNEVGQIEAIGAAPHKGIAQWLAEKKDSGIQWSEQFLGKSEITKFDKLRTLMFAPTLAKSSVKSSIYIVYDSANGYMHVVEQKDLVKTVSDMNPYTLVRPITLDTDAIFAKDLKRE